MFQRTRKPAFAIAFVQAKPLAKLKLSFEVTKILKISKSMIINNKYFNHGKNIFTGISPYIGIKKQVMKPSLSTKNRPVFSP